MTSKCKECGELITKTGNFTMKIIPAKRIPKKARRMITTTPNSSGDSSHLTSFQKFLLKRSKPVNFIELTCGKCGAVSKIKMHKNIKESGPSKVAPPAEKILPVASGKGSRNKRKSKDTSAGLTLPSSVTTSAAGVSPGVNSNVKVPVARGGKQQVPPKFQSKKEMDNLKKILFNSKNTKKSGSSLKDFLSGI